jgi:predicted SnoaL-like aldol condensation-catalyzing enzyme
VQNLEANKQLVREFYDLAFNQHLAQEAVAKYMGPNYRQHNPNGKDGPQAFLAYMSWLLSTFPDVKVEFKRFIAEGDLVVVHSHVKRDPAGRGSAVIDIFRVDNGKIDEHWDVIQEIPETSQNQNTMF